MPVSRGRVPGPACDHTCPGRTPDATDLQAALHPRRQAGFLKIEALEHRPDGLVLDLAFIPVGDERGALGREHIQVQFDERVGAAVVLFGSGISSASCDCRATVASITATVSASRPSGGRP